MTTVKATVSLEETLFEKCERLAADMGIGRSRLFALALQAYLKEQEHQRLVDQINAALPAESDSDDETYLRQMRRKHQELTDEW